MSGKEQGNAFTNALLSSNMTYEDVSTAALVPVNLQEDDEFETDIASVVPSSKKSTGDTALENIINKFNQSKIAENKKTENTEEFAPVTFFSNEPGDNSSDPFSSITASGSTAFSSSKGIVTPPTMSAPPTSLVTTPFTSLFSTSSNDQPKSMVSTFSSPSTPVQTQASNSFRIGKKPVYAQFPGISSTVVPSYPGNTSSATQPFPSSTQPPQFASTMLSSAFPVNTTNSFQSPVSAHGPSIFQAPQDPYSQSNQSQVPIYAPPSPVSNYNMAPEAFSSIQYHWFYKKEIDGRPVWKPFSFTDSVKLEECISSGENKLVAVDGGRFDVDVQKRQRIPIYWHECPSDVRRCSWFYKGPLDVRYVPYEEEFADRLESEYYQACSTNMWHRRLEFGGGEAVIMHNASVIVHFCAAASPDEWGHAPESQLRPRQVRRGISDEFHIEDEETSNIDFVIFLVHGIGSICDFKFRNIVEAVDDFRVMSKQLMQAHFKDAIENNMAGRIELLPVSWREALHGEDGIDTKLMPITLKSIPKLRHFTNDTLLDVLFYTSPKFSQKIVDHVCKEMNRIYKLFLSRNKNFKGKVAVGGHSLGSLILFDILSNQPKVESADLVAPGVPSESNECERLQEFCSESTVQAALCVDGPYIHYPKLEFEPVSFFALGSPIAMFCTVRGIDLKEDFNFPTCPHFFNIFHPYDPIAYRIETMIWPHLDLKPVLIPHHKGRKRFHLELKDQIGRVGSDLKHKFLESIRAVYQTFSRDVGFEQAMDGELNSQRDEGNEEPQSNISLGKINSGGRVDYVLQEAPFESFNEYLFALTAHVAYWESEDTMLFIMRELYKTMNIFEDGQISFNASYSSQSRNNAQVNSFTSPLSSPPQPVVPYNTPLSYGSSTLPPDGQSALGIGARPAMPPNAVPTFGMDPTLPPAEGSSIGPPPLSGFVRKL